MKRSVNLVVEIRIPFLSLSLPRPRIRSYICICRATILNLVLASIFLKLDLSPSRVSSPERISSSDRLKFTELSRGSVNGRTKDTVREQRLIALIARVRLSSILGIPSIFQGRPTLLLLLLPSWRGNRAGSLNRPRLLFFRRPEWTVRAKNPQLTILSTLSPLARG